ncbi:MAG: energy-coupling factor transporter transmembrane component T [bacterium]|nr:energy-coupling factor transporter transmembrane component T [bacterium]
MQDKERPLEWLKREEVYKPIKDNHLYIDKTLLKLFSLLHYFKEDGPERREGRAGVKTAVLFFVITIVALTEHSFIPIIFLVIILVRISLLSARTIGIILKKLSMGELISVVILLPAYFLGHQVTVIRILLKITVTLLYVNTFAATVKWNEITKGLSKVHIPDLFLFTFDLTIKYIVVLGEECVNMLQALKVRSIGRKKKKSKEQANILGITFIKSKRMSEEMYDAMICRGYSGEYRVTHRKIKENKK